MKIRRLVSLLLVFLLSASPVLAQKFGDFTTRAERTMVARTPAEAAVVFDSFTGSDATAITAHSPEVGGAWVKHPDSQYSSGSASIVNNRLHSATGTVAYYNDRPMPTPDYTVAAPVVCVTALTSHSTGITGRMDKTANDFYSARHNNGSTFTLIEVIGGTIQRTVTHTQSMSAGQVAYVELKMNGPSIRLFVDGVDRGGWSDGVITAAGYVGVRFNGAQSSTTGFHLDEIRAYYPRPEVASRTGLSFGQSAVLPLKSPNPAYPDTTGYDTINVPEDFATLQAADNSAITRVDGSGNFKGVQIVLAAGTTTTLTSTLVLKKLTVPNPNNKWIIIRTSNLAGLPPAGTRATSAHASAMAKIVGDDSMPTSSSSAILITSESDTDVGWYRLVGIELTAENTSLELSRMIEYGSDAVTHVDNQAHHFGIDRCWIHGHDNLEVTTAVRLHAGSSFIVDSSITEIHDRSVDNQAIGAYNGGNSATRTDGVVLEGVLIQNCRLEAAGENVLIGGATTQSYNLMPSDWTFRKC
jgi:hypothetical protein